MATSFTKTYQILVTFSRDDEVALLDSDIQSVEMRNEIMVRIKQATSSSKGIYSSHGGAVSES